jgi:Cu/Ag efflux protein CusF
MKGRGARLARVVVLAAALAACGGGEAGHGEGVVLQVHGDGRVVIEHGDITGVMKAMTMEFEVDPALLEGIEPGDRVAFRIADAGGRYRVTELAERP